ncbi:TPA: DUF1294 domain-containing protein [Candidatus Magasanikbacteria bacterium]|nr:DUF1294 domain-containing protein [Candidatus Magasanikbacteria bacterium]
MLKLLNIQVITTYLIAINFVTFIIFGLDKHKSIKNKRRISEKTLWFLSLVGGSLGAMLAMKMFRHKTKKLSFQAILAVILALQILVIYWLMS